VTGWRVPPPQPPIDHDDGCEGEVAFGRGCLRDLAVLVIAGAVGILAVVLIGAAG
jgi:hypothetical protein